MVCSVPALHMGMRLLRWLFWCRHKRLTFPVTRNLRTYVVCLNCGEEFGYDWQEMKVNDGSD